MRFQVSAAICTMGLVLATSAYAASPSTIVGKWSNPSASGGGMMMEFSATEMRAYPVDGSGKPTSSGHTLPVTYKDLGGNKISVALGGGREMTVTVINPKSITVLSPSGNTQTLGKVN